MILLKVLKKLKNAEQYIIYVRNSDKTLSSVRSDSVDDEMVQEVIKDLTPYQETVNNDQDIPEPAEAEPDLVTELENAYKEIDYLAVKSKYYELLYNYTKTINDPNSGNANKAYIMYEQLVRYEKMLKQYEEM